MQANPAIDDNLLSAWLDGELEAQPEVAARVQQFLDQHPDQAARVAQWRSDGDAMRAQFQPLLEEPVPAALERVVWRQEPKSPRWALAAAAVAVFAIGTVVGALMGASTRSPATVAASTSSAGWLQRAAYAHSLYAAEPRHAVEVKGDEEHLSRWLTSRVKVPITLFDLRSQGFDLVGGRLLPDGNGKSAQLMYQDAQGVRITVYLRQQEANPAVEPTFERQGELGVYHWVEDGTACALVGALPRERLHALLDAIYPESHAPAPGAPARPTS